MRHSALRHSAPQKLSVHMRHSALRHSALCHSAPQGGSLTAIGPREVFNHSHSGLWTTAVWGDQLPPTPRHDLGVSYGRFLAPVTVSYSIYFSLWFLLLQFILYSQILNLPCQSCTPLICCALSLKLCLGHCKSFFDALLALFVVFCR
jgi:hypothetical protein